MPELAYRLDPGLEISGTYDPVQPEETSKMTELRERVQDVLTPDFVAKYGGPQRCMERFIIARQGNVNKAEKMLRETIEFRKEWNLDGEFSEEELKERAEWYKKMDPYWPVYVWGFSKDNHTLVHAKLKDIKPKELTKAIPEPKIKEYYLTFMENVLATQNYINSAPHREGKEWKGNIEIYDFKGISRHQVQMHGLRVLKRVLGLGQGNYPENLHKTLLINAPWFFSAAFKVVSIVLNKNTLEKLKISSGSCIDELTEIMGSKEMAEEFLASDRPYDTTPEEA